MKKLISLIVLLQLCNCMYGQQIATYSQYMVNGLILNPAYAGSKENLAFTSVVRKQWAGVNGSPEVQTFSAHSPLTNNRISIGGYIVNEKIGVENRLEINAVYSYRIFFREGKLSLGILGGMTNFQAKYSDLQLDDINDDNFVDQTEWFRIPNLGFGVYWYNDNYYLGFSIPKFLSNYFLNEQGLDALYKNHYLITGGFLYQLNEEISLKPSTLIKVISGNLLEIDINTNVYYNNFCLGASYRTYNSFNILLEMNITKDFKIGYSYDMGNKYFRSISMGTHEISLNYVFKHKGIKSISPRFF